MKIKNIKLNNFKFHNSLEFNINKNCLIYGENGTGKSSIYKALYSNLYYFKDKKIVSNMVDVADKFLHRDFRNKDLKVEIEFDNNQSLNRVNNTIENRELLANQTIYLCDEKVLRKIVTIDFYTLIENELIKHFVELEELLIYRPLEDKLRRVKGDRVPRDILDSIIELNKVFRKTFYNYMPIDEVNKIIKKLKKDFEIEFVIEDAKILNKKLIPPTISLKVKDVDDKGDFKNHFNEAKLKLISIAIYFALAKKYETNSELKILVLDDFLTSLDMANRKLIMQYILDNFKEYQKIVMTHNLQFNNLIIKLLKMREESRDWDIKNIFLVDNNAYLIDVNHNYLIEAEKYLGKDNYNLEISGNFLRKEFEYIVHRFEQILEMGRVEEMSNILNSLKNLEYIMPYPKNNLLQFVKAIKKHCENNNIDNNLKVKIIKQKIVDFDKNRYRDYRIDFLKDIVKKTEFYKDILMNSASHDDKNREFYKQEFTSSIELLKELNKILDTLK